MGLLITVLEVTQYHFIVHHLDVEIFGGIVGILFLLFGIWIGSQSNGKVKEKTQYNARKLNLSNRELEVLELISQGFSNQEIADKIFVSLNTVKTHVANIYQKMGVKRRTQAIQKARIMSEKIDFSTKD